MVNESILLRKSIVNGEFFNSACKIHYSHDNREFWILNF